MKAQRDELFHSLPKYGWQVVEVQEFFNVPWVRDWVDEFWIIESIWRPAGFRAYIFFLVDPQSGRNRGKGQEVWAVRISKKFKNIENPSFGDDYWDFSIGKSHWKESLKEIFAELASLRQRGLT